MKIWRKRNIALVIFLAVAIVLAGVFLTQRVHSTSVTVEYLSGVEQDDSSLIGACKTNKHADGENVEFTFTEPFPSLDNFEEAKTIKVIATTNGIAKTSLPTGNYGLYMTDKAGKKRLYDDLELANASSSIPRDSQGPWYIKVKPGSNAFIFTDAFAC